MRHVIQIAWWQSGIDTSYVMVSDSFLCGRYGVSGRIVEISGERSQRRSARSICARRRRIRDFLVGQQMLDYVSTALVVLLVAHVTQDVLLNRFTRIGFHRKSGARR